SSAGRSRAAAPVRSGLERGAHASERIAAAQSGPAGAFAREPDALFCKASPGVGAAGAGDDDAGDPGGAFQRPSLCAVLALGTGGISATALGSDSSMNVHGLILGSGGMLATSLACAAQARDGESWI